MGNRKRSLKIITLNARGLVSIIKRRKLYIWLKRQNFDIIFLQEVHCTKLNVESFRTLWQGNSYYGLSM